MTKIERIYLRTNTKQKREIETLAKNARSKSLSKFVINTVLNPRKGVDLEELKYISSRLNKLVEKLK